MGRAFLVLLFRYRFETLGRLHLLRHVDEQFIGHGLRVLLPAPEFGGGLRICFCLRETGDEADGPEFPLLGFVMLVDEDQRLRRRQFPELGRMDPSPEGSSSQLAEEASGLWGGFSFPCSTIFLASSSTHRIWSRYGRPNRQSEKALSTLS